MTIKTIKAANGRQELPGLESGTSSGVQLGSASLRGVATEQAAGSGRKLLTYEDAPRSTFSNMTWEDYNRGKIANHYDNPPLRRGCTRGTIDYYRSFHPLPLDQVMDKYYDLDLCESTPFSCDPVLMAEGKCFLFGPFITCEDGPVAVFAKVTMLDPEVNKAYTIWGRGLYLNFEDVMRESWWNSVISATLSMRNDTDCRLRSPLVSRENSLVRIEMSNTSPRVVEKYLNTYFGPDRLFFTKCTFLNLSRADGLPAIVPDSHQGCEGGLFVKPINYSDSFYYPAARAPGWPQGPRGVNTTHILGPDDLAEGTSRSTWLGIGLVAVVIIVVSGFVGVKSFLRESQEEFVDARYQEDRSYLSKWGKFKDRCGVVRSNIVSGFWSTCAWGRERVRNTSFIKRSLFQNVETQQDQQPIWSPDVVQTEETSALTGGEIL